MALPTLVEPLPAKDMGRAKAHYELNLAAGLARIVLPAVLGPTCPDSPREWQRQVTLAVREAGSASGGLPSHFAPRGMPAHANLRPAKGRRTRQFDLLTVR